MAEKKSKTETPAERKVLKVNLSHTPEEVLQAEENGYVLRFNEESFLDLGSKAEKLSHKNKEAYFVTKGLHIALLKQRSKDGPTAGLTIIDPLGGKAKNKLTVLQKGNGRSKDVSYGYRDSDGKEWHFCWKRPDEIGEAEEEGYITVGSEEKDIVTRGATSASSTRVIKRKDGTDDLVLMKIPMATVKQHSQAIAFESTKRSGASPKELMRTFSKTRKILEEDGVDVNFDADQMNTAMDIVQDTSNDEVVPISRA